MKIIACLCLFGAVFSQEREGDPEDKFTQCLDGWYQYENKCYKHFGLSLREWKTWENARDTCVVYGARLASMHSKKELDFVVAYILLNAAYHLWIGLNSFAVERQHDWVDKTNVTFTNWEKGEPTYTYGEERENCVQMVFKMSSEKLGQWNDVRCNRRLPYICQMPTNPLITGYNPKYCSDAMGGGYSIHHSCYHIVNTAMTWSDAEAYCLSHYAGHLAAVSDDTVGKFLGYVLSDLGITSTFWIGLKAPQNNSKAQWSSGWLLLFTNWANSNQQMREDTCASFLRNGQWEMRSCRRTFPFICEVSRAKAPMLKPSKEGSSCPIKSSEWTDLGGDFCYFFNPYVWVNWYEAAFQCYRRGGTVTSIHSKAELDSLGHFARFKEYSINIGLIQRQDGSFGWIDGSELDFEYWDLNEPNIKEGRCVDMRLFGNTFRWSSRACDFPRPYICSIPKIAPDVSVSEEKIYCPGQLYTVT